MARIRCHVITRAADALPRDHVVNTVYFNDANFAGAQSDYDNIATGVRDVFRARTRQVMNMGVEVKCYDLADAEPRPVRGSAAWANTTGPFPAASGPREVALCLSYFSGRNIAGSRGRIYIGPWSADACQERPSQTERTSLTALADGLANVGGADVDWCVYSAKTDTLKKITAGWVDDEWDTIRSRGLKSITRSVFSTSE